MNHQRSSASPTVHRLEPRRLLAASVAVQINGSSFGDGGTYGAGVVAQNSTPTFPVKVVNDGDQPLTVDYVQVEYPVYVVGTVASGVTLAPNASLSFTVRLDTSVQGDYFAGRKITVAAGDVFEQVGFTYDVGAPASAGVTGTLGTLGSTDKSFGGFVSYERAIDSSGTYILQPKVDVVSLTLPNANNALTLVFRADATSGMTPGSMQYALLPDSNGNGKLDLAERATPLGSWSLALPTSATPSTLTKTLSVGNVPPRLFVEARLASLDTDSTSEIGTGWGVKARAVAAAAANVTVAGNGANVSSGGSAAFGTAAVGAKLSRTFTVKNTGGSPLNITGVTVSNGNFELAEGLPASLAAGASNDFTVDLIAATAGAKAAVLTVKTNDPDTPSFVINLSATVAAAVTRLEYAGSSGRTVVPAGASAQSKYGTYLGAARVGTTATTKTFYLKNPTSGSVAVAGVSVPAGVTVVTALPSSVGAGKEAKFELRLDAAAERVAAGLLKFTAGGITYTASLFGAALAENKAVLVTTSQGAPQTTLFVAGRNASADSVAIKPESPNIRVSLNGAVTKFAAAGVARMEVYGFGGNDSLGLTGAVPPSFVLAGDGNDTVNGGDANDTIIGDTGDDVLYGNGGNDTVDAGAGNDTAYGGAGNDSLLGQAGLDSLRGDAGDDSLYGGADDDKLFGGDGNDLLTGDAGRDTYDGGAGTDTAFLDSTDNPTRISVEVLK
jgi:Ca2+-binding RTX toxin-like protein